MIVCYNRVTLKRWEEFILIKAYINGLKMWKHWDGRTRRRDYWLYSLCDMIVACGSLGISLLCSYFASTTITVFAWIFCIAYMFLSLVPTLAITIRRLHDTGRGIFHLFIKYLPYVVAGILALAGLGGLLNTVISLACSIIFIVWMASAGTVGKNQFGPDPKCDNGCEAEEEKPYVSRFDVE